MKQIIAKAKERVASYSESQKGKIVLQFIKEFWLPFLVSFFWTVYNYYESSQNHKIEKILANFGGAFFLVSWFGGQINRIIKQKKTESSFEELLERIENVTDDLQILATDIQGYSTGGESFCFLDIRKINDETEVIGLKHLGKYPLYNVSMTLKDINNLEHEKVLNRPRFRLGDVSIGNVKLLSDGDKSGHLVNQLKFQTNDENYLKYTISYYCRKGNFEQDLRIIKFEGKWYTASQVRNGDVIIHTVGEDTFPIKNPFIQIVP